jgi:hypothetical protein
MLVLGIAIGVALSFVVMLAFCVGANLGAESEKEKK